MRSRLSGSSREGSLASSTRTAPRVDMAGLGARAGRLLVGGLALLLFLLLVFPLLALFLHTTPAALAASLREQAVLDALVLSFETTALALLLTLALGTPTAYLLARGRFRGKRVLDSVVDLPIVVPPAAAGLALLLAFGRLGLLGAPLQAIGIQLSFSTAAVVLAQTFVACPFYIRAARAGFISVDRTLEDASATLGYGGWGTFRRVTVPLALPALFGGAVLTWARALGEFGATILFAGNLQGVTQTMPLAIYALFESGDLDGAITLSALLVVVGLVVLLLARLFGE